MEKIIKDHQTDRGSSQRSVESGSGLSRLSWNNGHEMSLVLSPAIGEAGI